MARRFGSFDESDVRVRPGKGSRPRTKDRPKHKNAKFGMVITKDRGRWGVALDDGPRVTAMRARELGRTAIEVGDRVGVVGDTSGKKDTLARIVKLEERTSVLRRTADDTDPYERIVVANADQMLIVTAVADPPPRSGFVERALIAAFVGNIHPILCLTKTDLTDPAPLRPSSPILMSRWWKPASKTDLRRCATTSTATSPRSSDIPAWVNPPWSTDWYRMRIGRQGSIGRRQRQAHLHPIGGAPLPAEDAFTGGWIIDTPGIRSFGLAHVDADDVLGVFEDLAATIEDCPAVVRIWARLRIQNAALDDPALIPLIPPVRGGVTRCAAYSRPCAPTWTGKIRGGSRYRQ